MAIRLDEILRTTVPTRDASRFEDLDVLDYVPAGSSRALEALGPADFEDVSCVRCGAKIQHVFVTSHGPMGGDCLATLTGNEATRSAARRLDRKARDWIASPSLVGFRVSTGAKRGATIEGVYAGFGRDRTRVLAVLDDVLPALVHGVLEPHADAAGRSYKVVVDGAAEERRHTRQARAQTTRRAESARTQAARLPTHVKAQRKAAAQALAEVLVRGVRSAIDAAPQGDRVRVRGAALELEPAVWTHAAVVDTMLVARDVAERVEATLVRAGWRLLFRSGSTTTWEEPT